MKNRESNSIARRIVVLTVVMLPALLSASCSSSYRSMTAEEKRTFLAELETETLAELGEKHPEAQTDLDNAVGYAVFSNRGGKIPIFGAGEGIGVVVDTASGERSYLKVGRIDVGGGLGARTWRLVFVFFDEGPLKKLASGKLEFGAGLEAGAGETEVGTGPGGIGGSRHENYVLYQLTEKGVSATFTVRVIRYSVLHLDK